MQYKNLSYWDGVGDNNVEGDILVAEGLFVESTTEQGSKDMSGLFAIPGLIDAHIHLCLNPEIRDPFAQSKPDDADLKQQMRGRALTMLRAGITSARDLGGGEYLELDIRDEIASGDTLGPRLLCSGQPITSVSGHCHFWGGEAKDQTQALQVLQRQHQKGVDLIKIMVTGGNITPGSKPVDSQFDDQTVAEIVKAAKQHDYLVAAHCHGAHGISQATSAGVTTLEHCSWVNAEGWGRGYKKDVVNQMVANGVSVSPTINSGWKRFKDKSFVDMVQNNYRQMKAAGVRLIASTDAGIPNIFHHDLPRALPEFSRFAELSAVQTLRAATSDCAAAIGLEHITGKIVPGLSADMVLYERNPLDDLSVLEHPVMVVARGVEIDLT